MDAVKSRNQQASTMQLYQVLTMKSAAASIFLRRVLSKQWMLYVNFPDVQIGVPKFLPDSCRYGSKACNLIFLSLKQLLHERFTFHIPWVKLGLTHCHVEACS